jgi:phage gp46-like protein
MTDVRFRQQSDPIGYAVQLDWLLSPMNQLQDGRSLQSAMIVALGSNALADVSDPLPDPNSTDRGGWWGDLDAQEIWGGWPVGSKLWLLKRSKITSSLASDGGTVYRAQGYGREATQPFVDLKIASAMSVSAERSDVNQIDMRIVASRGPASDVELRYAELWDELLIRDLRLAPGVITVDPAPDGGGDVGGGGEGSLDFSDPDNSQYIPMI